MRYHIDKDKLVLAGDIHGQPSRLAMNISYYDIRDSHIVLLGDVGMGFAGNHIGPLSYLSRIGKDRNNTFYVFRGNHDNPDSFRGEVKEMIEGKFDNIKVLDDFDEILLSDGHLGLIVPGGLSIDRKYAVNGKPRTDGKNYWINETIDYVGASDIIEDPNRSYDFILAHSGPLPPILRTSSMLKYIAESYDPDIITDQADEFECINKIIDRFKPKYWINGHYHVTETFEVGSTTVYALDMDQVVLNPFASPKIGE